MGETDTQLLTFKEAEVRIKVCINKFLPLFEPSLWLGLLNCCGTYNLFSFYSFASTYSTWVAI